MNTFEFRTSSWEAENAEVITGYAVVFDQRTVLYKDPVTGIEYGEIIDRHALDGADMSDVVLRYNHQGRVLARTRNNSLQLSIDNHGLNIRADMSGSDEAVSFYKDVKSGLLDKMSFAFQIKEESYDRETNTRRILAISCLRDVSLVDFPAYEQTQVSARNHFESFAEPDRSQYRTAQVKNVHAEIQSRLKAMGFHEDSAAADYLSPAEYEAKIKSAIFCNGRQMSWNSPDETEPLRHQILLLRDQMHRQSCSDDLRTALALRSQLDTYEAQLMAAIQKRTTLRKEIAAGGGNPWNEHTPQKKEDNMNTESRAFFEKVIETRAASTSGTMTAIIPSTVMNNYVIEVAPGAFLEDASITGIAHEGNLSLPISALKPVEKHEENAAIETDGFAPDRLLIEHDEYAYITGYSAKGKRLSVANLEKIVCETLLRSMMKKMDGLCFDAVARLNYVDDSNAVKVELPDFYDMAKLAGMLGPDYIDGAKWYMSSSTYFNWMLPLKDYNGDLVLGPGKPVDEQAPLGFHIRIDSQVPPNTIYFGNGHRVHLNYAADAELNMWTDYDHNTEKAGVRCVAGATAEVGSFVKLYMG